MLTDKDKQFLLNLKNKGYSQEEATAALNKVRSMQVAKELSPNPNPPSEKAVNIDSQGLHLNPAAPLINAYNTVKQSGGDVLGGLYQEGKSLVGGAEKLYGMATGNDELQQQGSEMEGQIGAGLHKTFQGAMGLMAAPLTIALKSVPGGDTALKGLGKIFNAPADLGGFIYDKGLESAGLDPSKPEFQTAKAQLMDAINAGTIVATPKIAEKLKGKITESDLAQNLSDKLKESAKESIGKVFNPTTKANKLKTNMIADKIISGEEKLPSSWTQKGLEENLRDTAEGFGENIGATKSEPVLDKVTGKPILDANGDPIMDSKIEGDTKVKALTDWADSQINKYTQEGLADPTTGEPSKVVLDKTAVDNLQTFKDSIEALSKGKKSIPNDILQGLKEKYDAILKSKGSFGKTDAENTAAGLMKDWRDVLRDEIAKDNPELDALNKKYHFFKSAADVMKDTITRKTGQKSIGNKLNAIFGAGLSVGAETFLKKGLIVGGTVGLLALLNSTKWRLVNISLKIKLADALATGDQSTISSVMNEIVTKYPSILISTATQQNREDQQ